MPGVAWHGTGGTTIDHPLPANETLLARRGLYATMSYVDSLVGDKSWLTLPWREIVLPLIC